MANDFLSQLLKARQPITPEDIDDGSQDQDLMSQIALGAPPIQSELNERTNKRTKQILAPSPFDRPDQQQMNPLDARQFAEEEVSGIMNQEKLDREADAYKQANAAREAAILKRKIMEAQGAPADALPEIPPEINPNKKPMGMAESLAARSGDVIKPSIAKKDASESEEDAENTEEPSDLFRKERAVAQTKDEKPGLTDKTEDELETARRRSDALAGLMMIGKGAQRIGAGISHTAPDEHYMEEMKPLINKPVEDVMTKQKAGIAQLQKDMAAYQYAKAKDSDNPESNISEFYRDSLKDFSDQVGMKLRVPDNISAAEIEKLYPQLVKLIDAKGMRDYRMQYAKSAGEAKAEEKQNKAYTDLREKVTGKRAPADVQLALKNSLFIKNANELLSQYPDLNKMPQDQVNILRSELARIATGSVATSHAMQELDTPTFKSNFNKFMGKVRNNPTGADLGAFLKNNTAYLKGLKNAQDDVLNKFRTDMYKGYKNRISPEQQQEFQQDFPEAFHTQDLKTSPDEKVRVINPDGKSGYIKKTQLEAALKQGYKLAEPK